MPFSNWGWRDGIVVICTIQWFWNPMPHLETSMSMACMQPMPLLRLMIINERDKNKINKTVVWIDSYSRQVNCKICLTDHESWGIFPMVKSLQTTQHKTYQKTHTNQLISDKFCSFVFRSGRVCGLSLVYLLSFSVSLPRGWQAQSHPYAKCRTCTVNDKIS